MTPFTHAMLGLMCQTQNNQIKKLWSKNETSSKQPNNENCIKSYISHFWDSDQQESRFWTILKIFLKFHILFSILGHFYFTFTSRSQFPVIFILLSFLDLVFQSFSFHFYFLKRVKEKKFHNFSREKGWDSHRESFLKIFTIQGGCRTKKKVRQESF